MRSIPETELMIDFTRSSGPGGQNVNKTSTKAQLRWNLNSSNVFTSEEKIILATKLSHRLNLAGEIMIDVSETRSQPENKQRAIDLLHNLVNNALEPETPRVPTRVPRSAKENRLSTKKQRGGIKQLRKPVSDDHV
jgi:ribosome-associated protein